MHRIANTSELQSELQQLLDYARSERPSRTQLASALRILSRRVSGVCDLNEKIKRCESERVATSNLIDLQTKYKVLVDEAIERASKSVESSVLKSINAGLQGKGCELVVGKSSITRHATGFDFTATLQVRRESTPESVTPDDTKEVQNAVWWVTGIRSREMSLVSKAPATWQVVLHWTV